MASSLWDAPAKGSEHLPLAGAWSRLLEDVPKPVCGILGIYPSLAWELPESPKPGSSWGSLAGPAGPYLGREQRQRMSLASSAAEHHAARQALPLVVTRRRALPSLSELPVGKG